MKWIKKELNNIFQMMDLGAMNKILGLGIQRDRAAGTLKISQEGFINIILA
jgi:hypothetical protein